jgi:ligand-binding sensor domain-containing protein
LLQYDLATEQWMRHDRAADYTLPLTLDSNGTLYAARATGLYKWTDTDWQLVVPANVTAVADKAGGVWVASPDQGKLWHYASGQLITRTLPFDTSAPPYMTVDSQNRLWAAQDNQRMLWQYDGATWRSVQTPLAIQGLANGPDGRIWLSGYQGIAAYNPARDRQP